MREENKIVGNTGSRPEEEIKTVTIDVEKSIITISDNDMDIPRQEYEFVEEDEWFEIHNREGEGVMSGNIWWDEQWSFQYVDTDVFEDGTVQCGSYYRCPDNIEVTNEKVKHPEEVETSFTVVVDGKIITKTKVYDYAYNRALGVALYLELEFENTRSPQIMDKWASEGHMVVIFKN